MNRMLIFAILVSTGPIAPVFSHNLQDNQTVWLRQGEEFVHLLQKGAFKQAMARMAPVMKQHLNREKLAALWSELQQKSGNFRKIIHSTVDIKGKYHRVHILCQFAATQLTVMVVLDETHLVSGLWFLPAKPPPYQVPGYVDTTAFQEREISFGAPGWKLPGVLTIPETGGPFPGVVLVQGSGPNDRDETIGPNRPFRDIAWGLATRGILVFRYDKRTKIYGAKMTSKRLTVDEEVIEDALSALGMLVQQPQVKQDRIYLLGHSLGAMLAPEIATRAKHLTGLILMAAPARTLEKVTFDQLSYLQSLTPQKNQEEKAQLDSLLTLLKKIQAETLPETTLVLGAYAHYYYDLHARNQIQFAKKLTIPCLLLQGERDYQVTLEDFRIWKKELAGFRNFHFIRYPELNHLFMVGKGKSTPEEYLEKQRHVAPAVIRDLTTWIKREKNRIHPWLEKREIPECQSGERWLLNVRSFPELNCIRIDLPEFFIGSRSPGDRFWRR